MSHSNRIKEINPGLVVEEALQRFDREIERVAFSDHRAQPTDGSDEVLRCPYCRYSDICEHLLLEVDSTNRDSTGAVPIRGALYDLFVSRLADDIQGRMCSDEENRRAIESILEEIERVSNEVIIAKIGESGEIENTGFYCSTQNARNAAIKSFRNS